jgi:hypothetical protein
VDADDQPIMLHQVSIAISGPCQGKAIKRLHGANSAESFGILEAESSAVRQSETRIAIGFCLIRQSSVSPIVCVHLSNQVSGPHSIGMPRRFMVVPWTNERRVGAPAALPSGDPELKVKWLA